jgi:hypothetical protein
MRDRLGWAWWLDSYGGPWRAHAAGAVRALAVMVWMVAGFIVGLYAYLLVVVR